MKKCKYLLSFIIMFACLIPVTFAATIRETMDNSDDYSTLEENSIIIGVTKFSPNNVITASEAATAGANDAMLYVSKNGSSKGYKAPGVYYYIDSIVGWFFIDSSNKATPVTDEATLKKLSNLDIYYVDNVEKVLEIAYTDNNINEETLPEGVSYQNNKLLVNATVSKFEFMTNDQKKVSYVMDNTTSKFIEDVTSCYTVNNNAIVDYDSACGSNIVIPLEIAGNKITGIGSNAFKGRNIESVVIPSSIATIGNNAFANNELKEVIIKDKYDETDFSSYGDNVFGGFEEITYDNELTRILSYVEEDYVINYYKNFNVEKFTDNTNNNGWYGIQGFIVSDFTNIFKENGYNHYYEHCWGECYFEDYDLENLTEDFYGVYLVPDGDTKYTFNLEKLDISKKKVYKVSKEMTVSMKESGTKNNNDIVLDAIKNLQQDERNEEFKKHYNIVTRIKFLEDLEDLYDVDLILARFGMGGPSVENEEIVNYVSSSKVYYLKDGVLYQSMDNVLIVGEDNYYYPSIELEDYESLEDYVASIIELFPSKSGVKNYDIKYTSNGLAYQKGVNEYETGDSYYIEITDKDYLESWTIEFVDYYEDQYDENGYTKEECFEFKDGVITDYDGYCGVNVVIPDTIGGVAVTEIANYGYDYENDVLINSFSNMRLKSVVLPSKLKVIGSQSFDANRLTTIEIPDSVTEIGSHAFSFNNITSVEIPDSVTFLDYGVFYNNDIENVKLGKGITVIESNTFAENKIKDVEIPSGIKTISYGAFSYNEIEELVIPEGVEEISEDAFSHNKISSLTLSDTVKNIGPAFNDNQLSDEDAFIYGMEYNFETDSYEKYIASYGGSNRKKVIIPEDTKLIGFGAFADCDIEEIVIPYGVEEIDFRAFANNSLTFITVPDSVSYFGSSVFDSNAFEGENQFIYLSDEDGKIDYTSLVAYSNNSSGQGWFDEEEIIIPDTVEKIWSYAFSDGEVKKLVIPYGVKEIGEYAFTDVYIYDEFTLPKSIEKIGERAFNNYAVSEEDGYVYARNEDGTIDKSILMAYVGYVDDGVLAMPEGIVEIRENVFYDHSDINKVILPSSLKKIGNKAFRYSSVNSVLFNDNLEIIGDYAFDSSELDEIKLPSSLKEIGKCAFMSNYLEEVNVPGSVKEIKASVFAYNELTSITLNDGLEKIGKNAFIYNDLTQVTIPSTVKEIEEYAFYGNDYLSNIVLNEGLEKIGQRIVASSDIDLIIIPASVKEIGDYAFGYNVEEIMVLGKSDESDFEYLGEGALHVLKNIKYELALPKLQLPSIPTTVNRLDSNDVVANIFQVTELSTNFMRKDNGTYSLSLNFNGTKTYSSDIDEVKSCAMIFKLYDLDNNVLVGELTHYTSEMPVGNNEVAYLENVFESLEGGSNYSLIIEDYKE